MLSQSNTEAVMDKFIRDVVKQSRTNLTKKDKNVSKKLYNSINGQAKVTPKSLEAYFEMEQYGQFQDLGVKGKSSSIKEPNSPFKFGSGTGQKGGLTKGIENWVTARRFQFKDRQSGKFLSYKQTAFLITRSVYQKGIKATNFFTRPFELAFNKLPDELVEAYGLDIELFIKQTIKNGKKS
jgi:hypothetical protein